MRILSNLPKFYEKLMYNRLYDYFDNTVYYFQVNEASEKGIVLKGIEVEKGIVFKGIEG